ncbi:hypothetical protein KXV85_003542, partial [Aspergillus fumigatus]
HGNWARQVGGRVLQRVLAGMCERKPSPVPATLRTTDLGALRQADCMSPSRHTTGDCDALAVLDRGCAGGRHVCRRGRRGHRGTRAEIRTGEISAAAARGRQGCADRRRRTHPRGRRLLLHGHGRTCDPARRLRAGDPVEGVPAGAEGGPQWPHRGDLFRMGRFQRSEDHHPLAADRRSRDRRC